MPGRQFNSDIYRYGFNGKENDNEVKGITGSQQDYGFRIYDPRLGRFLSIDPLTISYPWYTPFQFAGDSPIAFIDIDGKEEGCSNTTITITKTAPTLSAPSKELTKQLAKKASETAASNGGKAIAKAAGDKAVAGAAGAGSTFFANFLGTLFFMLEPANSDYAGYGAKTGTEPGASPDPYPFGFQKTNPVTNNSDNPAPMREISTSPSELSNEFLKAVEQRIKTGEATLEDYVHQDEIIKRKREGSYDDNTSKPIVLQKITYTKLKDYQIEALQKKFGEGDSKFIEKLKTSGGKSAGQVDLYKDDNTGEIVIKPKGTESLPNGESTGYKVNDIE